MPNARDVRYCDFLELATAFAKIRSSNSANVLGRQDLEATATLAVFLNLVNSYQLCYTLLGVNVNRYACD